MMVQFSTHWILQATRFLKNENGATAIEYGLIAAFISLAIISTVFTLGSNLKTNLFQKVANLLS